MNRVVLDLIKKFKIEVLQEWSRGGGNGAALWRPTHRISCPGDRAPPARRSISQAALPPRLLASLTRFGFERMATEVHCLVDRAPPARRIASWRSLLRLFRANYFCGIFARTPWVHGWISCRTNKAVARACHGRYWPETNAGASASSRCAAQAALDLTGGAPMPFIHMPQRCSQPNPQYRSYALAFPPDQG